MAASCGKKTTKENQDEDVSLDLKRKECGLKNSVYSLDSNSCVPLDEDDLLWGVKYARTGANSQLTGNGVRVYVFDTGIYGSHPELKGKVGAGFSVDGMLGNGTIDKLALAGRICKEHGTSVASVIAGEKSGIAKNVVIIPLKMAGCEEEGIAAGLLHSRVL